MHTVAKLTFSHLTVNAVVLGLAVTYTDAGVFHDVGCVRNDMHVFLDLIWKSARFDELT